MSTRSNIGIRNEDGTITSIYCHSDGYEEYNGVVLRDHYTTEEKVRELITLGGISCLGKKVHPTTDKHSFKYEDREKGVTVAYKRDRGATGWEPYTTKEIEGAFDNEWGYLWENGSWKVVLEHTNICTPRPINPNMEPVEF